MKVYQEIVFNNFYPLPLRDVRVVFTHGVRVDGGEKLVQAVSQKP